MRGGLGAISEIKSNLTQRRKEKRQKKDLEAETDDQVILALALEDAGTVSKQAEHDDKPFIFYPTHATHADLIPFTSSLRPLRLLPNNPYVSDLWSG